MDKANIQQHRKWLWFGVAIIATVAAIFWLDNFVYQTAKNYADHARDETTALGEILQLVRIFGIADSLAIFVLCAGILGKRRWCLSMLIAFILVGATVEPLKNIVQRTRPNSSNNKSFPSGDTATAFTMPTAITAPLPMKIAVSVIATGVGFSRIMFQWHYLSDILAGAIIGLLCGFFGNFLARKIRWLPPRYLLLWGLTILLAAELLAALMIWHHRHVVQMLAWYAPIIVLQFAYLSARNNYRLREKRILSRELFCLIGIIAGLFIIIGVWFIDYGGIRIPIFSLGLTLLYFALRQRRLYRYGRKNAATNFSRSALIVFAAYAVMYAVGVL